LVNVKTDANAAIIEHLYEKWTSFQMSKRDKKAIVLYSGGQDSTVCLVWALGQFDRVETIGFDYGQRHRIELETRLDLLSELKRAFPQLTQGLGDDHVLDVSILGQISETSLTREVQIEADETGLPSTFVPARNLVFLTMDSAVAWRRGANILVGGMCETDFSGYPDCRRDTLDAQAKALSLGLDRNMAIETPLMYVDKAATWAMAYEQGGQEMIDLIVEHSHTCYLGDRSQRHEWGYGCGECPACDLRARGWAKWQLQKAASGA